MYANIENYKRLKDQAERLIDEKLTPLQNLVNAE
jgi:hypothetical protein